MLHSYCFRSFFQLPPSTVRAWLADALAPDALAAAMASMISKLPNTLVIVTLVSNFGTFLLYMVTCVIAIVAFNQHHMFHGFKHLVVPIFGLVAMTSAMPG